MNAVESKKVAPMNFEQKAEGVASAASIPLIGKPMPNQKGIYFDWNGYRLNLRIVDDHFYLIFIDNKGFVAKPPVKSASMRYESTDPVLLQQRPNTSRPLSRINAQLYEGITGMQVTSTGNALISDRVVRAPYIYWVTLSLLDVDKNNPNNYAPIKVFPRTNLNQVEAAAMNPENKRY